MIFLVQSEAEAGKGTYVKGESVYASRLGQTSFRNKICHETGKNVI